MTGVGRPGSLPSSSTSPSLSSSHGNTTTRIDDLLNITHNMHPPARRNPRASLDLQISTTTPRRASFNSNNNGNNAFVPRIVRGTSFSPSTSAPSASSALSFPSSNVASAGTMPVQPSPSPRGPSVSPTRTRRGPSSSAVTNTPHPNISHRIVSAPVPILPPSQSSIVIPPPSLHATSFPRPSYLEHSSFRHILLSESESTVSQPPEPYRLQSLHASSAATKLRRPMSPEENNSDVDSTSERGGSTARGNGGRGRTATPSVSRKPVVDTFMRLPTRWSDGDDRYPSLSVSVDGRDLTFHGPLLPGDKDAAACRTNFSIPPACGVYYYEIKILNKGQKGHIGIGFGVRTAKLSKLPGLEKKSWGYHGEDGYSFASEGEGSVYGPKFTAGDVVGCGIDFSTGQAFFTNNGRLIGPVFNNLTSAGELYPTVGLRTQNESIRANFGQDPFMFDIETHVEQSRNQMWAGLMRYRIGVKSVGGARLFVRQEKGEPSKDVKKQEVKSPGDEEGQAECVDEPMHELIMGYLAHHGYVQTAQALKGQFEKRLNRGASAEKPVGGTADKRNGELQQEREKEQEGMLVDSDSLVPKSTDANAAASSTLPQSSNSPSASSTLSDSTTRQSIIRAITCGRINAALAQTKKYYPDVLGLDDGMILFKLRCRQFVELVLEAARVSKKGLQTQKGKEREILQNQNLGQDGMDIDDVGDGDVVSNGERRMNDMLSNGGMVDADNSANLISNGTNGASLKQSEVVSLSPTVPAIPMTTSQLLLQSALSLGQILQADYKADPRPEVQSIYKRTLGLVAYEDPFGEDEGEGEFDFSPFIGGGNASISGNGSGTITNSVVRNGMKRKHPIPESVREMASQAARDKLAEEVNKAILESQGKPPHPALERLYRHTQACVVQLGWLGVGAAAFADMPKEFLED